MAPVGRRLALISALLVAGSDGQSAICTEQLLDKCKNNPIKAIYTDESCKCVCSNQWRTPSGASWDDGKGCTECPSEFGGPNCDQCAEGYFGTPPNCDTCRASVHCTGHADQVGSGGAGQCGCKCRNHWEKCTGSSGCTGNPEYECGYCPEEYDPEESQGPGTDCKFCAQDRLEDAQCTKCTSKTHCNDHAVDVQPKAGRKVCQCTCRNHWEGPSCDDCPGGWDRYEDCGKCQALYYGSDCGSKCDAAADCSGHASLVEVNAAGTGCKCVCDEEWDDGADCRDCGPNAIKVGGQCKLCKNSQYCNGHAEPAKVVDGEEVVAADSQHAQCICNCRNHWEDKTGECDFCPEEYEGDCDQCKEGSYGVGNDCKKCSIDDCGGSDVAKACGSNGGGKAPGQSKLTCQCKDAYESEEGEYQPGWYYGKCSKCKSEAVGTPPNCIICQAATSWNDPEEPSKPQCYGHQKSVEANAARTKCECVCKDEYEEDSGNAGGHCDTCKAGYFRTSPTPQAACQECTSKTHCNDHAASVTSSADRSACDCTCEGAWESTGGEQCNYCDTSRYEIGTSSPYCSKCKAGHIKFGKPSDPKACRKCDLTEDCGGRAKSVDTDSRQRKCVCECMDKYEGDKCDKCADGYVEFDTCRQCTVQNDCESDATYGEHADTVGSDSGRTKCVCNCKSNYAGDKCDECAEGHINYPQCEKCTSAQHCSNHADPGKRFDDAPAGVEADPAGTKCVCTCRNKYEGETCDVCPSDYLGPSEGEDCDKCRNGAVYPSCGQCTVQEHCNDHADKVEPNADKTGCVCTCTKPWIGEKCDTCEHPWDPASGCTKCVAGYVPDGDTCRKCSVSQDCNDNAKEVTSDGLQCQCQGNDEYCTRENGKIMSDGNGSCRCGTGKPGYQGYCPCGDVSVAPYYCWWYHRCNGMWSGYNCGSCGARYNRTRGCGYCAHGYVNYPYCRQCTKDRDCGARAVAVESDEDGRYCRCSCEGGYRWEHEVGCYYCAPGYVDRRYEHRREYMGPAPAEQPLPVTTRTWTPTPTLTVGLCDPYRCSIQDDCSDHADSVTSDESSMHCICNCREGFESPHWYFNYGKVSPAPEYASQCDGCAPGYYDYPDCFKCTNNDHCSGNAVNVTDDGKRSGCNCTCYGQYTGDKCETCPSQYRDEGTCHACAPGRIAYPHCILCDVNTHCNGHATNVTDNGKNGASGTECVCACRNQWGGARGKCNECPQMYGGADCDECANGASDYPTCGATCSVASDCNHMASSVKSGASGCECECYEGYAPPNCATCAEGRDGDRCEVCKRGWYMTSDKSCMQCSVDASCHGHASAVTSRPNPSTGMQECQCTCTNNWLGDDCSSCPQMYGGELEEKRAGGTCSECRFDGVHAWAGVAPNCKMCDIMMCNGNADYVTSEGGECKCVCRGGWEGDDCTTCDENKYDKESGCDMCAAGLGNFPECRQCSLEEDCFGYAEEVETDGISCVCKCDKEWCGGYGRCAATNYFAHKARRLDLNITATATETVSCRGLFDVKRGIVKGRGTRTDTITPTLLAPQQLHAAAELGPGDSGDDDDSSVLPAILIPLVLAGVGGALYAVWRRRQAASAAENLENFEKRTGKAGRGNWRQSLQEEMIDEGRAAEAEEGMGAGCSDKSGDGGDDDDDERLEV
eukprot:TRINITY_DN3683_c0_g1_i1.p1 TRINITY_DN3683_c0_g1~~TRINITY_DN3683_c0_g1_i1.p1  ORF type:complete len:1652 (+),score=593.74 TRINITY_DN3683_c0_g1_i1:81-5036(+)